MQFLLPSQCAKRREANGAFSIAGAVCAAPTPAWAVHGAAISRKLAEGGLSGVHSAPSASQTEPLLRLKQKNL